MYLVLLGLALIGMNLARIGPVGTWNWDFTGDLWKFVLPFILAVVWWAWADKSGLNKRREMEKMEERKRNRRKEQMQALGMDVRSRRRR
jgi:small Trp-rich protein